MSIKKEDLQWISTGSEISVAKIYFDNLTELFQDTALYVMFTGMQLTITGDDSLDPSYPVIKKNGNH